MGRPARATIAAVSMTWENRRRVPNRDEYFHRHILGDNVKLIARAGLRILFRTCHDPGGLHVPVRSGRSA